MYPFRQFPNDKTKMAIESNNIRSLIWTNVKYSIEFSSTFTKKHPFVSSTLLLFILFYILSPSNTWFFIYSLPLLFFFTILLILFFSIPSFQHLEPGVDSRDVIIHHVDKDQDEDVIEDKRKAFLRARSVRQRKSKKCIETGAEEFIQGASFRIPFSDDFVDKGALIEEKLKDIREVEVHSISHELGECSSSSSIFKNSRPVEYYEASGKCFKSFSCMYERRRECFGETEYDGARNKAVQWKKDEDQKNLMDLGLSEIERTRRLESLMARRRARKMLSLQVRRSLMNIGCKETFPPVSAISIPKHKESTAGTCPPTPGSAPSILGPNQNPFDLPYDQHEEKPNVRGGSFMQEFMLAQEQKDLMLSRHESFCMGRSDLPSRQRFPETSESSKSRQPLGKEDDDRVVEKVPSQASEQEMNVVYKGDDSREGRDNSQDEKDNSEVQIKSVLVEDVSNRISSSSSSEDDEPLYKIDKDAILKSIASPPPRNLSGGPSHSGSSLLENTIEDEHLYYPNHPMHHTPGQSIASDLQVEASEVGSPPLTNDGSSSVGEEISIDGEIEKAITSSSEDTLMSSSHLARVDENESNSREVREVTEQDIVEFGFSRFHMSDNNVPQNILSERTIEPYSTGSSSYPPPRTNRNQASSSYQQRRPEGLSIVGERFQSSLLQPEFPTQQLPFASTSLISPTSVLQPNCLMEYGSSSSIDQLQNDRSANISSERSDSIASQESDISLSNSTLQVSELPSETENSISARENDVAALILDSASEQHSENLAFSTIGQGHHSFDASSTSSSKSVSQPKFSIDQGSSSNLEAQQVDMRRLKNKLPAEVNTECCDPTTSRSSALTLRTPTVQNSVPHPETQKSAENLKSQETLCNSGGKQPIEEVCSTISQSFDDSQASSSTPHDLVIEQISIASTSSSSPNTMIRPKISASEGSSTSEQPKRKQDPIAAIPSERAANHDSFSLQSTTREVPTASSCSSSPKSVLEPKSSTGQGPLLNFDREEQIGESPSPRMSTTLLVESGSHQLHHADAKTKPSNDKDKSHEEATNHNDVKKEEDLHKMNSKESSIESPNKTTMMSSNNTSKHQKSSDIKSHEEATNHNDVKKEEDLHKMNSKESSIESPDKTATMSSNNTSKHQNSSDIKSHEEATNHNDVKKEEDLHKMNSKESSIESPDKTTMVSSNNTSKHQKSSDIKSHEEATNHNDVKKEEDLHKMNSKESSIESPNKTTMMSSNNTSKHQKSSDIKSHEEATNHNDVKKEEDLHKMKPKESSIESPDKTTMVSSNNTSKHQKSSDIKSHEEATNHNDVKKEEDLHKMNSKESSTESPNKTTMMSSNNTSKHQKSSDIKSHEEATNHNDVKKEEDLHKMNPKESSTESPNKTTMMSSNKTSKHQKSSDIKSHEEATNHNDVKKEEDLHKMNSKESSTESPNKTTMMSSNNTSKHQKSSDIKSHEEATNHNDVKKEEDLHKMNPKESSTESPNKTTMMSSNNTSKHQKSSDIKSHEEATNHNDVKTEEDLHKMNPKESSAESPEKTTMVSSNNTSKHQKSSDVANFASPSTNKNETLVTPSNASEESSKKGNSSATKEIHSDRTNSKEKAND